MKLLIVRSSQKSSWGSCKVISPNLQQTYELLPEKEFQTEWFDIPSDYKERELDSALNSIHELAEKIKREKPDQLVFIDHLPNPAEILTRLTQVLDLKKIPPVTVHIYGDFTYFSKDWLDLATHMTGHQLRFVTASASQKKLLGYFCEDASAIQQFCFPVNTDDYFYDHSAREEIRRAWKIEDNDIVLLYSGRVSLQKNVDLLLQEYLELLKNDDVKIHLWIAGGFDDLGAPFMGLKTSEGYLYSKLQTILKSHPEHFVRNVKILGNLSKTELRKIQSAADLFVSFSLYHDEDFGMSPAEAMACGMPALLTDWGGYSSFASTNWRCKLAPVKITEYGLEIKTSALKEFYELYKQSYVGSTDRERWAREFASVFSIKNNAEKLQALYQSAVPAFAGFNWTLAPFAQIYSKQHRSTSIDPSTCPSSKNFYAQVYRNYLSLEENPKDRTKVVNWTYDFILNSQQETGMPVGRKIRPGHYYLRPFSNDYTGPHNPVLLGGYITKKLLNKKMWSLRDGLIPLSFFFREHTPEQDVFYALETDFWYTVPEQWKKNVLFYQVKAEKNYSADNPPERILLAGMQDSVFADESEFYECLAELKSSLGEGNLAKAKITAIFPYKKNNLWGKRSDDETFSMAQSVLRHTGLNVDFVEWNDLKNEGDLKNCLYFELNKKYFIADSYLKYFALSKGAGLLKKEPTLPLKEINSHRLSPHHSISLYAVDWSAMPAYNDPFQNKYFSYFEELCKGQLKTMRISPNWESWYPLYLKKFYKLNPPAAAPKK